MSNHKKYPLPGKGTDENLILTWESGYRNVKAYYNKQAVAVIENPDDIRNGFSREVEGLGLLELYFNTKPLGIGVRVDGINSPLDLAKEKNDFGNVAIFFWILFTLSVFGTARDGLTLGIGMAVGMIVSALNIIITGIYLVAAIYSRKGQPWAYMLGTFTFCFTTILTLVAVPLTGNLFIIIQLVIRAGILYGLFSYFKQALEIMRKPKTNITSEILDF